MEVLAATASPQPRQVLIRGNMENNESRQPLENKDIYLDQVVNSKDEAYNLYQAHAFKMGFSVRKGKELYYDNEKRNIRLKEFYCSKRGFKNNELQGGVAYGRADSRTAFGRADSRTGCEAMVRFNISKEGVWKITKLVTNHNHDFAPPGQRHLLRSMRNAGMEFDFSEEDKDKKIAELAMQLEHQYQRCAAYREKLFSFIKSVEEQTEELSTKIQVIVENINRAESEMQKCSQNKKPRCLIRVSK